MQRPSALSNPSPQNFFIKKLLIFFLKKSAPKKFLILSQKEDFLIFQEIELSIPKIKIFQEGTFRGRNSAVIV